MVLRATAGTFQWQITVMSHLLKVLTFSQQTLVNNMNYFRSRFKYCELKRYCVLIGGLLLNADKVNVDYRPSSVTVKTTVK